MIATTIPAGIPEGCNITCPNVSANTSKNAPINIEIGRKSWCLGPTIDLAICGPNKPIKPIEPATETAVEDNITATSNNTMRSLPIFTPTP